MTIKDVQPVRVLFGEMPAALQRRDVDAYVGAEPGPGISLATGVGKIVEYPYSTPTRLAQHGVRNLAEGHRHRSGARCG